MTNLCDMKADKFKFRLYVAGDAANSIAARKNLQTICCKHLPDRHEIEIVDVYIVPERALMDSVFLTPTLVKFYPSPVRQIVGSLTDEASVLYAIGVIPKGSSEPHD